MEKPKDEPEVEEPKKEGTPEPVKKVDIDDEEKAEPKIEKPIETPREAPQNPISRKLPKPPEPKLEKVSKPEKIEKPKPDPKPEWIDKPKLEKTPKKDMKPGSLKLPKAKGKKESKSPLKVFLNGLGTVLGVAACVPAVTIVGIAAGTAGAVFKVMKGR